jgi:hypothetical protein
MMSPFASLWDMMAGMVVPCTDHDAKELEEINWEKSVVLLKKPSL